MIYLGKVDFPLLGIYFLDHPVASLKIQGVSGCSTNCINQFFPNIKEL